MGEHETWFDLLPGFHNMEEFMSAYLARGWRWQAFQETHFTLAHVAGTVLVLLFVLYGALRFRSALATPEGRLVPPPHFGIRNFFEVFTESFYGLMEQVMGTHNAKRFLSLIGTFAFFIFLSNLI